MPSFRPELGLSRHRGPFHTDHDYQNRITSISNSDAARKLLQCENGVEIVTQMETALQTLNLLPHQESKDPGILQLESNFLDIVSTRNVVDSALYIVPVFFQGKLFLRYMETGLYSGFTNKFQHVLATKFGIQPQDIYPWIVYTDKDFTEQSLTRKYQEKGQTSRGFKQMMYQNDNSFGNTLQRLKPKLDQLKAVFYIQMRNARPSHHEDRLENQYIKHSAPPSGGCRVFFFLPQLICADQTPKNSRSDHEIPFPLQIASKSRRYYHELWPILKHSPSLTRESCRKAAEISPNHCRY